MQSISLQDRFRGCFLGVAVGDALGTTLEFTKDTSNDRKELVEIIGGGKFSLLPGQWTDDTSMTICLAESLIDKKGFDPRDQLSRYNKWYRSGHRSSNGQCFDIGITTRMVIEKFEKSPEDYPSTTDDLARAGNGSLMRLSSIPLFYRKVPSLALENSKNSSRTTHGAKSCIDACRYFTAMMIGILEGDSKENVLSPLYTPSQIDKNYWEKNSLCQDILDVVNGSYKSKTKNEIEPSGHVVKTLECVLWAFHNSDNFQQGLIKVVNLGGDADTTGAIFGQIAGAYYGINSIPSKWIDLLTFKSFLLAIADQLYLCSENINQEGTCSVDKTEELKELQQYLDEFENLFEPINRKILPGIHTYKKIEDFDEDVEKFFTSTKSDVKMRNEMAEDFRKRLNDSRSQLLNKLSRSNFNPLLGIGSIKLKSTGNN